MSEEKGNSAVNPAMSRMERLRKNCYSFFHILIICASLFLILTITIDTFENYAYYREPRFQQVQFWICIFFLVDFFAELILSRSRWRYLWTHLLFLLVSIPYQAIISHFGWTFSPKVTYVITFIPLIRGGYALAIVVGWFTSNKAASLLVSYLVALAATVYFASLIFFIFERDTNPLVRTYGDALWWAGMDMTTVGSDIQANTPVGRILSFVLAALGMMVFPIFTVYITSIVRKHGGMSLSPGQADSEETNISDNRNLLN